MKKYTQKLSMVALSVALSMHAAQAQDSTEVGSGADENEAIERISVSGSVSRFGATKSQTPIIEMARSISIETFDDMVEKGALNLSQTATYMSGVTAETFGFATRGDWIRARGIELPRYRDSVQELFGSYNTTRAEVYTLEQVEVLRGPASVLYGQGSPGGIVNYISKTPKEDDFLELNGQIGTFGRKQFGVDANTVLSDSTAGRFVGVFRDSDTQVDYVDDSTLVLMPSVTFTPAEDFSLTLIALHQETDSDTASQFIPVVGTLLPLPDGSYIDQDVYAGEPNWNKFDTEATQLTMLVEYEINDNLFLSSTALWRDGEADYNQAWPTFIGAGASRYLNDIIGAPLFTATTVPRSFYQADNSFEQMAFDIRLAGNFQTGELKHEILVGVQSQKVETDNNFAYFYGGGVLAGDFTYVLDLANPVYTGAPDQAVFDALYVDDPLQHVDDLGVYLSNQISLDNWRLTLGVRFDEVDNEVAGVEQSDEATSVSAGLLYKFEHGVSPYVNYAESFETVVGVTASGEQLKPEEATQVEFGIKYQPQNFPGYFSVAYFDIEITNLPNPNDLIGEAAQQLGESQLSGIEFEGKIELDNVSLQMAYATLDAEDPNGYELDGAVESNGSVWAAWKPAALPGFKVGAGVRYVGKGVSEDGVVRYETPSYTLGDLMFGYSVTEKMDIALNIRNVADKEYLTSCLSRGDCFPGVRRTVVGSVNYRF